MRFQITNFTGAKRDNYITLLHITVLVSKSAKTYICNNNIFQEFTGRGRKKKERGRGEKERGEGHHTVRDTTETAN